MKPSTSLLALLAIVGCGDDVQPESDPYIPQAPAPVRVQALSHDCGLLSETGLQTYEPAEGSLHIVGVNQARNHDDPFSDPTCQACLENPECTDFDTACGPKIHPASVTVGRGVRSLVLTASSPVEWTVTTAPKARLERVILSGDSRDQSKVIVPAGVDVLTFDLGFSSEWYTDEELALTCVDVMPPGFCDEFFEGIFLENRDAAIKAATDLIANAEDLTGDKIGSFHGCGMLSKIELGPEAYVPTPK